MTTKTNGTKPTRIRVPLDPEIAAMGAMTRLLLPLDQAARERVLTYLAGWTRSKGEEVAPVEG
jgi:hypothetical protein